LKSCAILIVIASGAKQSLAGAQLEGDCRMWWLIFIFALVPLVQPVFWLSIAGMERWPLGRRATFRRLAAGYFILPFLLLTAWLLLGRDPGAGAALFLCVPYLVCLVHAAIVLFSRVPAFAGMPTSAVPAARGSLLLDIAVVYCRVLGATALCGVVLVLFVVTVVEREGSENSVLNPIKGVIWSDWRGVLWLIYDGLTALLVVQLETHGVTAQHGNIVILAAILAVPLICYAWPWAQPWSSLSPPVRRATPV
jgi:hypothetical protein